VILVERARGQQIVLGNRTASMIHSIDGNRPMNSAETSLEESDNGKEGPNGSGVIYPNKFWGSFEGMPGVWPLGDFCIPPLELPFVTSEIVFAATVV